MNIVLGQVVYSKAGRDAGKVFVITGIIDNSYVYVSDGDLRRVESPKKKKVRHLAFTNDVLDILTLKIAADGKISNSDVRKALAEYKESKID